MRHALPWLSLLVAGCSAAQRAPEPRLTGPEVPAAGEPQRVYTPPSGRYVNEPTLVRGPDGLWHLFANGTTGMGEPWQERCILHATAPALHGPWTERPDALTTRDPGATEGVMHAPFVVREGRGYAMLYFDSTRGFGRGLHVARSRDLFHWTRDAAVLPGGRDPMVLPLPDGRELLYTVNTSREADGVHDLVNLDVGRALAGWGPDLHAVRNPAACPRNCWGWLESPFVVSRGGWYYLFSTYTSSAPDADDYHRTVVFRSQDPTRFDPAPVATVRAHSGEVHEEGGRWWLTSGGWPGRLEGGQRGLWLSPLEWQPAP